MQRRTDAGGEKETEEAKMTHPERGGRKSIESNRVENKFPMWRSKRTEETRRCKEKVKGFPK